MEVKIIPNEGGRTLYLEGRLDTPAALEVSKEVQPVIADAKGTTLINCEALEYISSSGLRILLSLRKAAAAQGGKVIIEGINDDVRQVLMMTGFLNLFEIR